MTFEEKALNQLLNQKTLMNHLDRALRTIDKFRNSHVPDTVLPVHSDENGEYVYLKDFICVRNGLDSHANQLARQLGIDAATAELRVK